MIEGSSVAPEVIELVQRRAETADRVLVCLDSNHTYGHVLKELEVYAPLVTVGSYCVVFDTIVEQLPPEVFEDRSWGPGNSPMTAVWEFLDRSEGFEVDNLLDAKLAISAVNNGYLKRVK